MKQWFWVQMYFFFEFLSYVVSGKESDCFDDLRVRCFKKAFPD